MPSRPPLRARTVIVIPKTLGVSSGWFPGNKTLVGAAVAGDPKAIRLCSLQILVA